MLFIKVRRQNLIWLLTVAFCSFHVYRMQFVFQINGNLERLYYRSTVIKKQSMTGSDASGFGKC